MNMYWPIALIVFSNVCYHICAKATPSDLSPFASLTVTYAVGAIASAVLFFTIDKGSSLIREYQQLNWSSFALGIAIVGLEAGSIYMYKLGWNISVGQLLYSSILAVILVIVGVVFYHESITGTKLLGILVCMVGLYFINK